MNRLACFVTIAALAASRGAFALGSLASVSIVDRDSGATLPAHYYRGDYWVAGTPGARYAIEIRNRGGGRLLAVTSVDGVNVISGDTAAWDQTGYVFDPGQDYQISGWRKSNAEVADFTFTDSPNSYAERTGRPANVGVIGVALFREQRPQPPKIAHLEAQPDVSRARAAEAEPAPAYDAARAAGGLAAEATAGRAQAAAPSSSVSVTAASRAPKLGTGHGEREYSYVQDTDFRRLQSAPNEVIRIRYDSLDNLVAMGIVRRPRATPGEPNPFPAAPERGFVPDPSG
jgi:hypothetical protein